MSIDSMKNLLMLEIIAPEYDDGKLSQVERDSIKDKYFKKLPWTEVFSEVKRADLKDKYIHLFEYIDSQPDKGKDIPE